MSILMTFRTVTIESVMKILLEIVPRQYALQINVHGIPLVYPEIRTDTYVIVIDIFDSSHLLICPSLVKDSVKSRIDDIVFIERIIAEAP